MAAQSIFFEIKGLASKQQIKDAFKNQQEIDASHRYSEDGYTGDFQTVDEVRFDLLEEGTKEYDTDFDIALDGSKKWDYVQAIYTKDKQGNDITLIVGWGAC